MQCEVWTNAIPINSVKNSLGNQWKVKTQIFWKYPFCVCASLSSPPASTCPSLFPARIKQNDGQELTSPFESFCSLKISLTSGIWCCLFFFLMVCLTVSTRFSTAAFWVRVSVDRNTMLSRESPELSPNRFDRPASFSHSSSSSPSEQGKEEKA